MKKKSVQIVENEIANIEEQEQKEALSNLLSFPINILSKQVEFSPDLD